MNKSSTKKNPTKKLTPRPYIEPDKAGLPIPKIVRLIHTLNIKPLTVMEMAEAYGCSEKRVFPTLRVLEQCYGVVVKPLDLMAQGTRAAHGAQFKLISNGVFTQELGKPAITEMLRSVDPDQSLCNVKIKEAFQLLKTLRAHPLSLTEIRDAMGRTGNPDNMRRYIAVLQKYCLINLVIENKIVRFQEPIDTGVFRPGLF